MYPSKFRQSMFPDSPCTINCTNIGKGFFSFFFKEIHYGILNAENIKLKVMVTTQIFICVADWPSSISKFGNSSVHLRVLFDHSTELPAATTRLPDEACTSNENQNIHACVNVHIHTHSDLRKPYVSTRYSTIPHSKIWLCTLLHHISDLTQVAKLLSAHDWCGNIKCGFIE